MQSDIKLRPAAPVEKNAASPPKIKPRRNNISAKAVIENTVSIAYQPPPSTPSHKKLSFIKRFLPDSTLMTSLLLIACLAGLAFAVLNYQPRPPADKKSLQVAGISITNQDEVQASQTLKKLAADQKINISINGQTYTYTATDLGISRDFSSIIDATYSPTQSLLSKLTTKKSAVGLQTYIEKKKMVAAIESKLGAYKTTVNASVTISGGNLVVNPGKAGIGLNFDQIAEQLAQTDLRSDQTVTVKFSQTDPAIATAAADDAKNQAETLIQPDYGVVADGSAPRLVTAAQKASWLVFTPNEANHSISVSLNTTAAQSTMTKLAQSYSQPVRDQITLTAVDGSTSVIDGGQAGVSVDQNSINAGISQFVNALNTHQPYNLPITLAVQQPGQKNLGTATGGKFVLVDKALYRAWAIDGSTVDRTMVVSTGRPGLETPSGHFNILSKTRLITMRGCNPLVGCWVVPNVPNAEFFTTNGDALHGTYWYINWGHQNLSHGCVNLQLADAAWLYDWTVVGTDVIVV